VPKVNMVNLLKVITLEEAVVEDLSEVVDTAPLPRVTTHHED